ncbi:unnamed protein product, partial [Prorocentrum cordatum]
MGGLAAGGRCDCHCEWAAAPAQGFLQLLQRQLGRCGPEQLHGLACPALPPPPVATLALVGAGLLFAGVVFGSCLAICPRHAGWLAPGRSAAGVGHPRWHEELLGARSGPSRWAGATPSGAVHDEDLTESDGAPRAGPLGGLKAGPANVEVFRFVYLAAQEKRELLEACEDHVRDNEGALDIEADAGQALVADEPRHGFTHGQADDLAGCQPLASGDRGVLTVPGAGPLFAVAAGSLSSGVGEGDLRTLPVRFDRSNRRFREHGDAVAIRDAGWTPTRRHFGWRNLLQVSHSDAGVEEHVYISEVLERACVFDQLNCSELETFEVLSRRYQLSEEPHAPESAILKEKRKGSPALLRPLRVAVGSGMAFGPQPPDDRPRDLLPFPGGRALDELPLGTAGGGLFAAGKRKARRRRGEEAWLRAGLGALSELDGGGRASNEAPATAAQASAVRPLAKVYGGRRPPLTDVDPLGAWKVLQGSGGGYIDSSVADSFDATYQPGRIPLPQSRAGAAPLRDVVPDDLQCMLAEGSGLLRDPAEAQAALHELGPAMALDPVLRLRGFTYGRFLAELLDKGILQKATVVKVCFYQYELPASLRPLFVLPPTWARYLPARWRKRPGLAEGDVERAFQVPVTPICEGPSKLCYSDNLAVVSDKECEAVNGIAHMLTTLEGVGAKAHLDIPDPSSGSLELLGFEYVALEYVLQAGATPSGLELERLIGHLVSMMMLRRDLLSALSAVYQFSRKLGRRRAPTRPSARRELRWAHALLPTIVARSDLQWLPVVTAYDASEWGLGVAESLRGSADVGRAGRLRERARFRGLLATAGGSHREHALHDEEELSRLPDAAALLLGRHARFHEVPRELLLGEGFGCRARGAAMEARRLASALAGQAPAEAPQCATHRQGSRSPEARLQRTFNAEGAAGLDRAEGVGLEARSRLPPRPGRPTRGPGAQRPPRSPPAPSPGPAAEPGIKWPLPRLSRLAQNSARPPTRVQHTRALKELAGRLAVTPLPEWTASARGEHLSDFLSVLFDRGGGPHAGELVMSAQLWALPPLGLTVRSTFPLTHQAAAGWARLRPPQSRPPIPWLVAAGIAGSLFAPSKLLMGPLIALLFVTHCRPGEGLALLGRQVIRPIAGMPWALGQVIIVLHPEDLGTPSKTNAGDSYVALDLPEHQWVGRALRKLRERRAPLQRLLPIAYCELLAEMKRAAVTVACEVLRPTPHGLRHGGASLDKALGLRSSGDIQLRGKWRPPLSVQRYEEHARISKQLERLDPRGLLDLQPREGKVFLEAFAGTGHLCQALRRRGAAAMSIDVRRGPHHDLRAQEVFNVVKGWILSGLARGLWLGTPCSSFSRA